MHLVDSAGAKENHAKSIVSYGLLATGNAGAWLASVDFGKTAFGLTTIGLAVIGLYSKLRRDKIATGHEKSAQDRLDDAETFAQSRMSDRLAAATRIKVMRAESRAKIAIQKEAERAVATSLQRQLGDMTAKLDDGMQARAKLSAQLDEAREDTRKANAAIMRVIGANTAITKDAAAVGLTTANAIEAKVDDAGAKVDRLADVILASVPPGTGSGSGVFPSPIGGKP